MTGSRPPPSAVAGIDRTRAVSMIVVRVGAVVLCGAIEAFGDWRWMLIWPLPLLLGPMLLGSAASSLLIAVTGRFPPKALVAAELAVLIVSAPAIAWYAGDRMTNGWPGTLLPYVLLMAIVIGITFGTVPALAAWTAALSGSLLLGWVAAGAAWYTALPHMAGLATNACMAAYVTRLLTRSARDLDRARAEELRRSEQLSRERERGRTARNLHDRILQTMEALARDGWIADDGIRARVAEEAQWLRAYLRGDDRDPADDVLAALEEVVLEAVGGGLRVEFNAGRLRSAPEREHMPAEIVEALTGVLREALTNVRKHAGVRHAVVRAEVRAGVVALGILDQGRGFDPGAPAAGLGIARSIVERARAVGGDARVESEAGEGTHVSVRIPLPDG